MKELKLEDKVCKVITKADEITIDQLLRADEVMSDTLKSELDKYVEVIQILSNLSVEEIEDLPIDTLKEVIRIIGTEDFALEGIPFKNEVVIDDITFKNRNVDGDNIQFTVKEIFTLKQYFNDNKTTIAISDVIAIIFREVDGSGDISRDLSVESIRKRSAILRYATLDVVLPFITAMKSQI